MEFLLVKQLILLLLLLLLLMLAVMILTDIYDVVKVYRLLYGVIAAHLSLS